MIQPINDEDELDFIEDEEGTNKENEKRFSLNFDKYNTPVIKLIAIIMCIVLVVCSFLFFYRKYYSDSLKTQLGTKAVMLLYNFHDLYELSDNMTELKSITTEDVYNDISFDTEERTLNTYLKFKGNSTAVNVLEAKPNYILYTLTSDSIDANRKFIFLFSVNSKGKISYVREMECIDFVKVNN